MSLDREFEVIVDEDDFDLILLRRIGRRANAGLAFEVDRCKQVP